MYVYWLLSHVQLFATPWTVAHQVPPSMGILQAKTLEWIAIPFFRGSSWPRDWTWVSCIAGRFFTIWATGKLQCPYKKRGFGYRPRKEKTTDDGGRDWSDVSTNQGAPRTAGHAQKLEEAGRDSLGETCGAETLGAPTSFIRSVVLPAPWFWTSGLQSCERIRFCYFKPLSLWSFIKTPLDHW